MRAATASLRVGTPVDVRCHAGCPWMGRFVVHEVTCLGDTPAYRVHRTDSSPALAIVVAASDVRASVRT